MEGRPLDDDELVARAREGDADAYASLVKRYEALAFRTAMVVSGSTSEAEDAAHEGFVKAYYALDRFRPGSPFRPWLLRIVANEARNRRRAQGRREGLAPRSARLGPSGDAAPSPEETVLSAQRDEALLAAVDSLPERDRLVLSLRYLLELDEAEMAAVMDCRRGTVKSRLSRALDRLRRQMGVDREVASTAEEVIG